MFENLFENKLFKTNLSKVVGLLLLFLFIAFLGSILFTCGLGFRKRTMFLRMTYMIISVVWVVGCIWWICVRVGFGEIWRGMIDELYARQDKFKHDTRLQYQELINRYPLAVAEYESECWKQRPRPSTQSTMENALNISNLEWEQREIKAKEKIELRKAKRNSQQ